MEEEFQESEVIFQENIIENEQVHEEINDRDYYVLQNRDMIGSNTGNLESRKSPNKRISNSVPITIPENMISRNTNNSWFKHVENFEDEGAAEMIPPHVITGRRIAGKMMSFSVCSGYGRTLKGRDLSQVRNSILRMTGFLEM